MLILKCILRKHSNDVGWIELVQDWIQYWAFVVFKNLRVT